MRLIDADKFIKDNRDHFDSMYGEDCADLLKTMVNNAPTVYAEPVVHARWKNNKCTSCGSEIPTEDSRGYVRDYKLIFCPYCGAKMDVPDINVGDKEDK